VACPTPLAAVAAAGCSAINFWRSHSADGADIKQKSLEQLVGLSGKIDLSVCSLSSPSSALTLRSAHQVEKVILNFFNST